MRFIVLLVAAVVAIVAGVYALRITDKNTNPLPSMSAGATPDVSTVNVLVAREPVAVGTILEESMIDKQPWPSHLVLDGFITAESPDAGMAGKVARASFQKGEPITRNKIANPNDPSFLAAALPAGMRAITLATDAVTGVAGYVFPGDRVDVIVTHNIPNELRVRNDKTVRPTNKPDVSELLVAGARVLAVNVRSTNSGKETASTVTPTSVTLAVNEQDVQAIRLAEKVGTLSLALRPLKDEAEGAPAPTVSMYLTNVKIFGDQGSAGVKIIRGAGVAQDAQTAVEMQKPEEETPAPASAATGAATQAEGAAAAPATAPMPATEPAAADANTQ